MKNKKKKLYCAFIDFAKAFDTVWRKGLWHKLLGNEINKVLNKYQILLRSHQIYNSSHIHSFLQETVGDHLNINFSYDGNAIGIVNEFTYLGLSFTNAKKVLISKAYKAMYEVLKKGRLHNLSIF
jgi:hypothetical protein